VNVTVPHWWCVNGFSAGLVLGLLIGIIFLYGAMRIVERERRERELGPFPGEGR
jgi:hypothetical protein